MKRSILLWLCAGTFSLAGCSAEEASTEQAVEAVEAAADSATNAEPAARTALYGELHVHTQFSFDAFIFGTRSTPDTAYEFAKGEPLDHPSGFQMKLRAPLDFQAVTDHAMYMGMLPAMDNPDTKVGQHPVSVAIREAKTPQDRIAAFQLMFPYLRQQLDHDDDLLDMDVVRPAWQATVEAAERHNDPGTFTTFVAYEYTAAGASRENLHRNVIFRDAGPSGLPFSSMDSSNPEDLWDWLDAQRAEGIDALAIPHNSNGSDGMMFALAQTNGSAMDTAYAEQRMRNEPIVEISQVKGTSETHPLLSPNDEWADFELMQVKIATVESSQANGSYIREAYLNGLRMEAESGFNPYRFGLLSASDTHVGAGSFDEDNYWSKVGTVDSNGKLRGAVPIGENDDGSPRYIGGEGIASFEDWGASGLAGVWAEENTRAAIFDAFRRKETFGTSGPRLQVRFFAGYGYDDALLTSEDRAATLYDVLYDKGVPMGGDLLVNGDASPSFYVEALRDPHSAPLQRLQIVKGWIEDGEPQEQVFDVACSDGGSPDVNHRCPDNGATVSLETCAFDQDKGDAAIATLWQDPTYDVAQPAFYYLRALENPSCRWSTWDAIRAGVAPRESLHATIQERAWSSPIWLTNAE